MAYLTLDKLKTHLYAEIIDAISREDDTIPEQAISEAISMAKGYLSRFDRTKLFDDADAAFVNDPQLLSVVKDIAVWRIIKLANPNVRTEMVQANYEYAINWLKDVQSGKVDPEGWPYKTDDADTDYPEGGAVTYSSNTKRNNHY